MRLIIVSRGYGLWEMVLNEFDPREEPGQDKNEQVSGEGFLDKASGQDFINKKGGGGL